MAQWEITMRINVLGIGNVAPQSKVVRRIIAAPTLDEALTLAKSGLLTVQTLGGRAVDPTDPSISEETVTP